jgi:hypothetical protein
MSVETFTDLLGHTMRSVTEDGERMSFTREDGRRFDFYHPQDYCESVRIEDIAGNLDDLVGSPILLAEEVSSDGAPTPECAESFTWTFYKFATAKGSVTVRWLGESNGYYGEGVDFAEVTS